MTATDGPNFAFLSDMAHQPTLLERTIQPINWWRAFVSGVSGAVLMMAFVDTCNVLGRTPFSFEIYMGSLFLNPSNGSDPWTVGLFVSMLLGGIFAIFYAYIFEYVLKRSSAWLGFKLGFAHAALAAIAFFPFFETIHHELHTDTYRDFGFFGSGMGIFTSLILLFGHLLFGTTTGLFYGPVRTKRLRARVFEPGESGLPGEADTLTRGEDPEDGLAA